MYCKEHAIVLTCDGSGDCTAYLAAKTGRVLTLRFDMNTLAATADFVVSNAETGEVILTESIAADAFRRPRTVTQNAAGAAANYASSYPVLEPCYLANQRVKVVVAQGGALGAGVLYVGIG